MSKINKLLLLLHMDNAGSIIVRFAKPLSQFYINSTLFECIQTTFFWSTKITIWFILLHEQPTIENGESARRGATNNRVSQGLSSQSSRLISVVTSALQLLTRPLWVTIHAGGSAIVGCTGHWHFAYCSYFLRIRLQALVYHQVSHVTHLCVFDLTLVEVELEVPLSCSFYDFLHDPVVFLWCVVFNQDVVYDGLCAIDVF